MNDTPRRLTHPNLNAPVLDWWARDYDHVFVVLNPFFRVPGTPPESVRWTTGGGSMLLADTPDALTAEAPDGFDEVVKTTGRPVRWSHVAQGVGAMDFTHFARTVWLWVIGAEAPDHDLALAEKLARYCQAEGLYKPEEDWLPLVLEPALARYLQAVGIDEVTLWDEWRETSLLCPSEAFGRDEPPVTLVDEGPVSAVSAPGLLLSWAQSDVAGLLAITEDMRARVDPARHFEGFWASARTGSAVFDPEETAPALLH